MIDPEYLTENRIVKYVESIGGLCLKLILSSERGFPDRTCLLPGGVILFIETKRTKLAKTYYMQIVWQERLRRRGFTCEFVNSVEDVAKLVKGLRV